MIDISFSFLFKISARSVIRVVSFLATNRIYQVGIIPINIGAMVTENTILIVLALDPYTAFRVYNIFEEVFSYSHIILLYMIS